MNTGSYTAQYRSPLGQITLASDGDSLTGLWFSGQKYFGAALDAGAVPCALPVFEAACRWLDLYFAGSAPDFPVPLRTSGTAFQEAVWAVLRAIPYGSVITYGEIAARLRTQQGSRACAQAVGGAVGHNPISILIPCHRVVGATGSLTGYAGGIKKKIRLLELEGAPVAGLFLPTRGSAL